MNRFLHRLLRLRAWLLLGACIPLLVSAHAVVVSSTPADRAVLTRVPPEVVLRFNAKLEKKLVHIKLERPDGASQTLPDVEEKPSAVRVPLPSDLPLGAYTLQYTVMATDGHATQGVLRFTLQGLP